MKQYPYLREPPASDTLKRHGKIVEDSFYLVENGCLLFEDGTRLPCTFEVAFMEDGQCWAVVYIPPKSELNPHQAHKLDRKANHETLKLTGQDVFWGAFLTVSLGRWVYKQGWDIGSGMLIEYSALKYEAVLAPVEVHKVDFFVANLPVSEFYSSKSVSGRETRKFKKAKRTAKFNAAVDKILEERATTLTNDELKARAFQEADNAEARFISENNSPILIEYVSLKLDDRELARFYWKESYNKRKYDTQPLSMLRLHMQEFPSDWNYEEAGEWICGLLSLSLGRVVNWNYYHVPPATKEPSPYLAPLRVWYTKSISITRFQAFTEEDGYFRMEQGIEQNSASLGLVRDVITYLSEREGEQRSQYLNTLLTYRDYASASASSYEFRCTLLCSLGEHIYKLWEKATGQKYAHAITKSERKTLLSAIMSSLEAFKSLIVKPSEGEDEKQYEKRVETEFNAIKSSFGYAFTGSLKDLFKWFFERHGWNVTKHTDSYYYLAYRIESFVNSRNKLFHEHRFYTELNTTNYEYVVSCEILNIEMFIPLLLATALGYTGRYWHPLAWTNHGQGKWEWMKDI